MDRDPKDDTKPVRQRSGGAGGTHFEQRERHGHRPGGRMDVVEEQRGGGLSGRAWERGIWQLVRQTGPNPAGPIPRPWQERQIFLLRAMRSHQKDFSRRVA